MDHVVFLDVQARELENLLTGDKSMIIRGAAGRKMPYGRVNTDDVLYFINNNAEGLIRARARVLDVYNSPRMSHEESVALVKESQDKLKLNSTQLMRWAGKRYLVFISVEAVEELDPFPIDKGDFGNMDDWLPVTDINTVIRR